MSLARVDATRLDFKLTHYGLALQVASLPFLCYVAGWGCHTASLRSLTTNTGASALGAPFVFDVLLTDKGRERVGRSGLHVIVKIISAPVAEVHPKNRRTHPQPTLLAHSTVWPSVTAM